MPQVVDMTKAAGTPLPVASPTTIPSRPSERSLKENLGQFSLLVLVNAFVGGMVGLERTVVPLIGSEEFGLILRTAIFSFIVTFGIIKALSNLFAGELADRFGRKKILVSGWIVGLPVPFMIMLAPSWEWIVAANVLLGINQGLAWSMTVVMKIDLVGPRGRGLAVGLNEFAGYLAVGLTALATGYLASAYGLRPEPFYLGSPTPCSVSWSPRTWCATRGSTSGSRPRNTPRSRTP
jgi:MFS family permease